MQWGELYRAENPTHNLADPIPAPLIQFRNKVTKEMYEHELLDIKNEVERKHAALAEEEPGKGDEPEVVGSELEEREEHERVKVAKNYQV